MALAVPTRGDGAGWVNRRVARWIDDLGFRRVVCRTDGEGSIAKFMQAVRQCREPQSQTVWEHTPLTVFILDNATTGMTGGQDSIGSGRLHEIALGLGVAPEHVRTIEPVPKQHDANVRVLREEIMDHDGVSVVIACRACVQTARRSHKKQ